MNWESNNNVKQHKTPTVMCHNKINNIHYIILINKKIKFSLILLQHFFFFI